MLVHDSDCSVSRVLSSCFTKEQQRKTYSLKHNTTETVPVRRAHHDTMNSEDRSLTGDNRKRLTKKFTRSCPTMHCFTAAPFRKLVFQKGTEPSCTSSTLLVKGKGHWDLRAPSSQHLPSRWQPPLSSSKLCGFFFLPYFSFRQKWKKKTLGCVAFLRRSVSVEVLTNMNY